MTKTVFLKSRRKAAPLHSLYNEMIMNPPEGYKIITNNSSQKSYLTKIMSKGHNYYYKTLLYYLAPLPSFLYQLREKTINYKEYDLIYASQHVMTSEKPWIVDLEYSNALAVYGDLSLCKSIISKRLESKNCRAILPWSNWAAETLYNSIDCKNLREKIKVLRYTVSPKKISNGKENKPSTRILFLGTNNPANVDSFEFKGLNETIEAFIDIQKKYDGIELVIRSVVPPEIKNRIKNYQTIRLLENPISKMELEELYRSSDIFSHSGFEVLNLSVLEAMSYGLPVIATALYNTPEAVKHMQNGILIELPNPSLFYTKYKTPNDYSRSFLHSMRSLRPYMKEKLKEYMKLLIEDSSLRQKIGKEAALTIEKGEFSIAKRNSLLKEVFDQASK